MTSLNTTNHPPIAEDEIDLFELWEGLVQEKWTVFSVFLAVIFSAIIYIIWVTPVYQAKAYLLPPEAAQVTPMNVLAEALNSRGVNSHISTTDSVFKQFQSNLVSRKTLKEVFYHYQLEQIYSPSLDQLEPLNKLKAQQKGFEQFMKDISVVAVNKKEASAGVVAQLSLTLDEAMVAEILNALVSKASQKTIEDITSNIESEKQARARLIEQKIAGARQVEKDRRLDRIAQLEEAIKITRQLNLTQPIATGPTLNINNINNMNETVQGISMALYLLGSDFLEAEKQVLEQRENDDAFIAHLRSWQEELQLLKSLKIEPELFGVMQIDQEAVFAEKIKPKTLLVLVVAGVLGLMLGVMMALIRRAVKKRKERVEEGHCPELR